MRKAATFSINDYIYSLIFVKKAVRTWISFFTYFVKWFFHHMLMIKPCTKRSLRGFLPMIKIANWSFVLYMPKKLILSSHLFTHLLHLRASKISSL